MMIMYEVSQEAVPCLEVVFCHLSGRDEENYGKVEK
jgi:hypothetical protein